MQTPTLNRLHNTVYRDEPVTDVLRPKACSAPANTACDFYSLGVFPDRSGRVGKVEVLRCRRCQIGISHPPIPDVAFLYADRTSQDFQPNTTGLAHLIKRFAFRRAARQLLASLPTRPRRLVDFGCGGGLFTRCLGDELSGGEVIGVDFHPVPPPCLSAGSYRAMENVADLTEIADLVLAMHVLEHDDDVPALLKRITSLVRPGGRVIIEVPNIDCVWASVFGPLWDAWYLPYHRTHFNTAGLISTLTAGGLTIEREIDICVPTMGRTIANALHRKNTTLFLLIGIFMHPIQWLGERLSKRPSAIRIVAQKGQA